jgi:hypothetical protein
LIGQKDFIMIEVGAGKPFLSTTSPGHETHLAIFTASTLRRLYRFRVRIQVKDGVGDVHERILSCVEPGEYWGSELWGSASTDGPEFTIPGQHWGWDSDFIKVSGARQPDLLSGRTGSDLGAKLDFPDR